MSIYIRAAAAPPKYSRSDDETDVNESLFENNGAVKFLDELENIFERLGADQVRKTDAIIGFPWRKAKKITEPDLNAMSNEELREYALSVQKENGTLKDENGKLITQTAEPSALVKIINNSIDFIKDITLGVTSNVILRSSLVKEIKANIDSKEKAQLILNELKTLQPEVLSPLIIIVVYVILYIVVKQYNNLKSITKGTMYTMIISTLFELFENKSFDKDIWFSVKRFGYSSIGFYIEKLGYQRFHKMIDDAAWIGRKVTIFEKKGGFYFALALIISSIMYPQNIANEEIKNYFVHTLQYLVDYKL